MAAYFYIYLWQKSKSSVTSKDEILDVLLIAHKYGRLSCMQLLCLESELKNKDFSQFMSNIYLSLMGQCIYFKRCDMNQSPD